MIQVVLGDLAEQGVDGILRPIRSDHSPSTPVSRNVAQRAGTALHERLAASGSIPVGGAVLTPGGALAADFVIHVVVTSDEEAETPATVRRALTNGLARAADWELDTLALPPLGVGVGNLDPEEAIDDFVAILREHLETGAPPREIIVVASTPFEVELLRRKLDGTSVETTPGA